MQLPEQQNLHDVKIDATAVLFDEAIHKLKTGGDNSMDSVMGKIDLTREKLWIPDKASEYDYCMVLPPECFEKGTYNHYTNFLQKYGLELKSYKCENGNIVILIRAPEDLLRRYADETNFRMKADPETLEKLMSAGDAEEGIAPVIIPHDPDEARYPPYEMIYLRYSIKVPDNLYKKAKGGKSPFSKSVRVRLLTTLIERKPKWGGENIKIRRYVLLFYCLLYPAFSDRHDTSLTIIFLLPPSLPPLLYCRYIAAGKILAYFPLHEPEKIEVLSRLWLHWKVMPWAQPFYNIKEYFGEKTGMYVFCYTIVLPSFLPSFVPSFLPSFLRWFVPSFGAWLFSGS
jgi:hypothetical protein